MRYCIVQIPEQISENLNKEPKMTVSAGKKKKEGGNVFVFSNLDEPTRWIDQKESPKTQYYITTILQY